VLSSTKRTSSSYSAGSLKQQSTGRYDDVLFVLDKHAELDSYSDGSLKQQSTGRYDDGRFVLDNTYLPVDCSFSELVL
jgi:hypothetical protein